MTRSSVDGDVPRIYADYVKQAGVPDAHPTVMDLVEQVNTASGRDRADGVLHGIAGHLSGDQVKALLGGDPPAKRPLGVLAADLPDDDKMPLFKEVNTQMGEGSRLARLDAEEQEQEEKPDQTPPASPTGQEAPEGPDQPDGNPDEKPEDKPEGDKEEEEAKNEECAQLQAAFEQAQEEMLAAKEDLADIQSQFDEVESEIEEIRQLIEDAEAVRDELASQGGARISILVGCRSR